MKDEFNLQELLVVGSKNQLTTDGEDTSKPLVIRGIVKKDTIENCRRIGRDFYYIDTGYLGNFPSPGNTSGKKIWHRIVKNDVQQNVIRDVPDDRWRRLVKQDPRLDWQGWKSHREKILFVLPNPKACRYYGFDYDSWVSETEKMIKQHIDLPIETRVKGSRSARNHEYSIYDALDSGVYATVTFNSIAALESVLYGVPAFVAVPCAAEMLSSNSLNQLKAPFRPDVDLIVKQCHNLAYGQFTVEEIADGTAWKILRRY